MHEESWKIYKYEKINTFLNNESKNKYKGNQRVSQNK